MTTSQALKGRIDSVVELQSVVKTMKALAAVNVRQFEKAAAALEDYLETVTLGLRVALSDRVHLAIIAHPAPKGRRGALVIGSDQGMCGQLNESVVDHTLKEFDGDTPYLIAVGGRIMSRLEENGLTVAQQYAVPGAVAAIDSLVRQLLLNIDEWHAKKQINRVDLYYSRPLSRARYEPYHFPLLPLDRSWLERIRSNPWPSRCLPDYTLPWGQLFSGLIRQYLYGALFRAVAQSLASENASRLVAMQGAESSIETKLEELEHLYQQHRQAAITSELLDIIAGFEALG